MDSKELCENFIAADKIINGEIEGNLTLEKIINDPKFKEYCPNNKCETYMKLNGFGEYLFDQLGNEIENEYYEYFMMWLSDKLFNIVKDKPQIEDITLNSAYDKYLKNHIKNGIYWSLLDIKQGLKEVNLKYMKQFYKLLNHICEAIVYYKPNKDDIEKFIINSTECYNQYSSLYNSVPKCNSYLHLLDNLKKTYEDFKNSVHNEIKNICPELAKDLQTLTIKNTNSYFVGKLKEFDFNSSECKPQKDKEPDSSKKMEQPPGPQSPSQKSGTSPQSKPKDSENSEGNTGGTPGNKGNSNSENGSPGSGKGSGEGAPGSGANGGSKAPKDQAATQSSGKSNGGWLSLWRTSLNPMSYMPNASSIYQTSKDVLISTTNKISDTYTNTMISITGAYNNAMTSITGAYNNAMTSITGAYDNAMTSITGAYDRTTNYIGNAVNSVTSQLNSFSTSQLGDNQSGSNSSEGGTDTSNHSQQNPPPPSLPPSPSPSITPPSTPQPMQQSTQQSTQQLSQTPSLSQPQSNKTQDKLQITVQNGTPNTLQQHDPNTGKGVQTMTITKATLSSSSTDPSITGSGITNGTVVKMIEKPSIWCIAQNKKYDILGIGIIIISIFAFLAIMYKYLSLGCTSKSKRKKSMKKVINSIGGKRPIQIIIKSYDRNKDLKPVINSVGRKKDPLLNIYKLMQADPVPFINVFFLLIFFVYKRQLNYLEL
ncbi:CIR protein PIR protein [Plasmodium vinckei]|uniref:CIR protein PIR protein n=1 Tax=Plasmodium vinckei TaxID=5860 RepID=A0A6V7S9E3_PLAVN|nr:CIR protein PIR protein [Plasmodium vinckei]